MEEFYKGHEGLIQSIAIIIGIIVGYISVIQPILNYTKAQKKQNNDKRFEIYHNLVDHFSGNNGTPKLDRQIAIAYEMRKFPEYFPVTKRIFSDWISQTTPVINNRLIKEMKSTIKFIDSNWFEKRFCFKKK